MKEGLVPVTDPCKPKLLMLTSSFPCSADDETCGYIRDFARKMSDEFYVTVLTLQDRDSSHWQEVAFTLIRAASPLPQRVNPLQAASDLTQISGRSLMARFAAVISLAGFAFDALRLARRADVICSHWMLPAGLIGATLSRLLGKPHLVVEHSGALHLLCRMRGGRQLARFILDGSNRIITVSRDLSDKFSALCPDAASKIEVLPMGIDTARIASKRSAISEEAQSAEDRTVLFVGRLTKIKGVEVLLKAAKELGNLRLVIAGDGVERDYLYSLARSIGVNAVFKGSVSAEERNDLLRHCYVVVMPSLELPDGRTEGMPLVALEAMAAGQAVIASSVGGLRELIADGENGLLFDSGDHLMLAEKLRMLFSDWSLRNNLAANARATAERYDWSIIGSQYREKLKNSLQSQESLEALLIDKQVKTSDEEFIY